MKNKQTKGEVITDQNSNMRRREGPEQWWARLGPVQRAIAHEFISRAMELVRARAGDNVDLTPACASHFGGITAGLHFEFLDRIR